MAAGEYVSVSQQADTERADVEQERLAQEAGPAVRICLPVFPHFFRCKSIHAASCPVAARPRPGRTTVTLRPADCACCACNEHVVRSAARASRA